MSRPILVIGHPGHELRIWHWVTLNKPRVFILTDGSGTKGEARLHESARLLESAGCRADSWFGAFSDKEIYKVILSGYVDLLLPLVKKLQQAIEEEFPAIVVGDMCEGYNPSHDLCRAIIGMSCELASRREKAPAKNLAFPLIGDPMRAWGGMISPVEVLHLDEDALCRKMESARGYEALKGELESALVFGGQNLYAKEGLYIPRKDMISGNDELPEDPPYYERYGEQQVAAGKYTRTISYRKHVLPLIETLRSSLMLEK